MSFNFVILAHFIGDFLAQNNYTSAKKGSDLKAMAFHVGLYFLGLCFLMLISPSAFVLLYCVINAVLHYFVDSVTAPISLGLFQKEDKRKFFLMLGLDQTIHYLCLSISYGLMFAGKGFFI